MHGFQGNSFDLINIKNAFQLLYENVQCLLSTSNEDDTLGSIDEMGNRLAGEICNYVEEHPQIKKYMF